MLDIALSRDDRRIAKGLRKTVSGPSVRKGLRAKNSIQTADQKNFIPYLQDPAYADGFEEVEISRAIDEYRNITHAFQSLEATEGIHHQEKVIGSYQLVRKVDRWLIESLTWTLASEDEPIPFW